MGRLSDHYKNFRSPQFRVLSYHAMYCVERWTWPRSCHWGWAPAQENDDILATVTALSNEILCL